MQPRRPGRSLEVSPAHPRGRELARRDPRAQRGEPLDATVLNVLGHDLRTPLAAAALSAEAILRTSHDPLAVRAAGRVLSSTRRMQRLLEQLLDYAWLRQGRALPLQRRECDLGELCRTVVADSASAEPEARLELEERGDPLGDWDPERVARILASLLSSAASYGPPGGRVRIAVDGLAADTVCLTLQHPGCLEPSALRGLLEPWQHAGGGLALELYVAREIARAHGGELTVATSDGDGTTFSVILPRRPPAG